MMSEHKFTPGPWFVHPAEGSYPNDPPPYWYVNKGDGRYDPAICSTWGPKETHEANAHLIAAAPDFMASAQSLIEAWDARTTGAQQIVTGKSDRELQKQAMDAIEGLRAAIAKATNAGEGA